MLLPIDRADRKRLRCDDDDMRSAARALSVASPCRPQATTMPRRRYKIDGKGTVGRECPSSMPSSEQSSSTPSGAPSVMNVATSIPSESPSVSSDTTSSEPSMSPSVSDSRSAQPSLQPSMSGMPSGLQREIGLGVKLKMLLPIDRADRKRQ